MSDPAPTGDEATLRRVFDMWATGLDGLLASFADHCHPDVVWWNSARGAVDGLDGCLDALRTMADILDFKTIEVELRTVTSTGHTVVAERVDGLYRADGSLIVAPPVVGIVDFRDGRIAHWRDYAADWLSDFHPATPPVAEPARP